MVTSLFSVFLFCVFLETLRPGWALPQVKTWPIRVILVNLVQNNCLDSRAHMGNLAVIMVNISVVISLVSAFWRTSGLFLGDVHLLLVAPLAP